MPDSFDPLEAQELARALAAVAAADGAVLGREASYLEGFAMKHGVGSHAWIAQPLDDVALARAIKDPAKRRTVVRLCLELAYSDRDFSPEEDTLIRRIARALSVPDAELADLAMAARVRK